MNDEKFFTVEELRKDWQEKDMIATLAFHKYQVAKMEMENEMKEQEKKE